MFSYMKRGAAFYRNVAALAIPMVLQNLVTSSLALLDTFMVGLLGEGPMAAVTLANVPIFVVNLMSFGLQSGASVLIAQFYGKKDADSINRVMGIAFGVAGGFTLLFGCVMFFLPLPFMSLFGNDPAVVAMAARYARYVAFSFFFDCIALVYLSVYRSMGNARLGMYILAAAGATNVFLNWVFIFGNLGAPAMGVEGAALATTLARVAELLLCLLHAARCRSFRLRPALMLHPGGSMLRRYMAVAAPVLLNETLWGLGFSMYATIMGHMENSQPILAAYGISGSIDKVTTVAIFAVSNSAAVIIGREVGSGRGKEEIHDIGKALNVLAFLTGLVSGLVFIAAIFLVFRPFLYPLFSLSPEAERIAILMSLISFSFFALRSFNTTNIVGVIRGGGDVKMAAVIDLSPLWLVSIPISALTALVLRQDIAVVLLVNQLENFVKFFLGLWRLRSGKWVRDVTAA